MIAKSVKRGLPTPCRLEYWKAVMNRREFTAALAAAGLMLFQPPLTMRAGAPLLRINGARLNQHLAELAEFGKNPQGGVSRVAYSEADRLGRDYVMKLMRVAKLDVSIDAD